MWKLALSASESLLATGISLWSTDVYWHSCYPLVHEEHGRHLNYTKCTGNRFFHIALFLHSIIPSQAVGQRLMDLGVFSEIQGRPHFVVSDAIYYQFHSSKAASTTGHAISKKRLLLHKLLLL